MRVCHFLVFEFVIVLGWNRPRRRAFLSNCLSCQNSESRPRSWASYFENSPCCQQLRALLFTLSEPALRIHLCAGWPVIGIWSGTMDGTDVNAVHRSPSGRLLATSDDFGKVNVFRYRSSGCFFCCCHVMCGAAR
jgi:hypothetical protein